MRSRRKAARGRLSVFAALALTLAIPEGCGSEGQQAAGPLTGLHVLSSITDGAVLADPVAWTAQAVGLANGDAIAQLEFLIDGRVRWTEHHPPYYFNDDHNHLYPWVLGAGPHRLAVRVTTIEGKSASTSAQVTVQQPPQPAALAGTYTRTVTAADIRPPSNSATNPQTRFRPEAPGDCASHAKASSSSTTQREAAAAKPSPPSPTAPSLCTGRSTGWSAPATRAASAASSLPAVITGRSPRATWS